MKIKLKRRHTLMIQVLPMVRGDPMNLTVTTKPKMTSRQDKDIVKELPQT